MKNISAVDSLALDQFQTDYEQSPLCKAMTHALSRVSLEDAACAPIAIGKMQFDFSNTIETLPVANQKASGRCWIFAGLNVLREQIAAACKLDRALPFELSQNYVAFWDKFEKINYFLESILQTLERDADDRTLCWILQTGLQDGGQWDMFANVVKKYGIVPKSAMPETFQSSNTGSMNKMANDKLRLCAAILRGMHQKGASSEELSEKKKEMLSEFYSYLAMCFGVPPKEFDFEYTDKDKQFHRQSGLTPGAFFEKYVGAAIDDYISIIHAPTADKPFHQTYTVDFLGSVLEGAPIRYLNLELETFKSLVQKQLSKGEIVWFGSDVGKFGDRTLGVWDDQSFDFEAIFGMDFTLTKEEQLVYRDSCMTHAMVLTGVNETDGKPNRWKIENSWGDERGSKGYYVCSDTWFDRYVYQAVVHKRFLTAELRRELEQEPKHLNPWDPMGSLAD